ncbi:DUF2860 family protein [Vibrio natriegens]|uniref:DUF2860 domain-containing protein n=1 Tax=Vibrio natriegens NBRC 15636 = ATCC 14048 = DSM 759 TaxID=1219067 RepID=A0AAN0Y682_VIBNA|nr:DUF2860 family protein [Vibrio natriegens]ALR18449.1 hypothetical protein PN96_21250 [Vibrio natriegens NBRC 15636 = ATCC 14048 = DSM 759]ANQ14402.1 hypothetical protein BA890_16745 [Vibrio natriegens NBRC 15636 = ATCC 14048 = DSM 759]EPM38754.1 hypothetical protein M272_20295 [Vibrio natriegens NBRC 15636 = ATCC 14048 = DSM 759]MDX6028652.1 DUF2860 family protein [Vibrio natriegens NBRC 15636 = ATCC 14048 = DSM 759]UUI14627.1 DUF2860 domain-containing protein [Vibrio natriegens]
MNKIVLSVFALLPVSIASANAFDTSRFSGEVSLNSGFSRTNSNLDTISSAQINHLGKGDSSNQNFVAPLGSLYYALNENNNQRVYLGTSRDDLAVGTLAFELGYQYDYHNGTRLDIGYLPTVVADEVWANPYLTGQERETTDRQGNAYRLKLSNLWNSGVSFDMAYATAEIDNEGINHAELLRDSETYYLKGQYRTMLNTNSGYITAFSYTDHDADGSAASFNAYKGELSYFYLTSNYQLVLTGSYTLRDFSAENPIFSKTRSDDVYRLFLAYEYNNIPGWDNWSVTSFVGGTINDSNIDFYSSDSLLMSVGMNYKF